MTSIVVSQRPSLASGTSVHPGGSATGPGAIQATTPGATGSMLLTSPVIGAGTYNPPSFSVTGTRPVPMKLFATWEVDRTPPNCIPRLCSLTVTRLVVFKSLGSGSVVVAVKMEGSKRTLRSNEILIPPHPDPHNGGRILDTELELTFSLQYPHFVKRGGNRLHVMLQRRKRYKNRAILVGFKTLAVGSVDMSQVLQKQLDLELELYGSDSKNAAANSSATGTTPTDVVVGKVSVFSLSSQPVDGAGATGNGRQKGRHLGDGEDDRTETEDEDDDYTSPDSDSADDTPRRKSRVPSNSERGGAERGPNSGKSARQQNLKQKFMALMKKFKVEGIGRAEQVELDRELSEAAVDPADIDYLFDQLEEEEDDDDLSDSGPDTISVGSTPKPSLKPFFCSSRSDLNEARMSVPISGSGGGPVSRTVSGVKSDDHANVDQTLGERHSDDSSKEAIAGGVDIHLNDNLTDDQENEMSDPPVVATTTTTTNTTASSGDDEARRDRSSKKADRPFTVMKQQQLSQQQMQPQQQQQQQKVLKDRASNDQLLRNTQLQQQQSHPGLDVSSSSATRKGLLEQLGRVLPSDVDSLPDKVFLANTSDHYGARLAEKLSDNGGFKVVCAANPAEVRASLSCLVVKIQKFCNTQTWESPPLVKVALIGADDSFVSSALRAYVEVFSSKPPDWQSFVKFYIVPPVVTSGSGTASSSTSVAKYIAGKDELYASLFVHPTWRELLEGKDDDVHNEIVARVLKYLNSGDNSSPMQLPVAEAMVTYKEEKTSGEESSQVFLPFLSDVRVGSDGVSGDSEDNFGASSSPSDRLTPPSSPRMIKERSDLSSNYDPVDLQLDYWAVVPSSSDSGNQSGSGSSKKYELTNSYSSQATKESKRPVETTGTKASIKASILHMQVQRLGDQTSGFTMHYWTAKEKKPKATVIRLGKKKMDPKEREVKSVEGITRLICLSKGHNTPLKVHIDGSEWSGVKFFQLSSQWQTHIKFFPVATFQPRVEASSSGH